MVYGYLRKIDPGRGVVLRQIRDVISGTAVFAPLTMKRPPLSEAVREIEAELIPESRQTSYVGPQDYPPSSRTAAAISAFTTHPNYLSAA